MSEPVDIDNIIASRIAQLRAGLGLSLSDLAERSGVSKAMISKIERQESSPTAAVLGRLAAGLAVTLTDLLSDGASSSTRLRRRAEQEVWRDPTTHYLRRQVADFDAASGSELIEIEMPPGVQVDYPPWQAKAYRQRIWLLEGELEVVYGEEVFKLKPGDRLECAVDRSLSFASGRKSGCRYLLNLLHA